MSAHSWFSHLTVAVIVERDGKFLCVEEHPRHHNVINQPAGHVEENESILDAVQRETLEETGYAIEPRSIVGLYYFQGSNGTTYLRVCFTADISHQAHPGPVDPDISAIHWLSLNELRNQSLRSPIVIDCIEDYLAGKRYPLDLLCEHIKSSAEAPA
jgi:8-oxo-dGTP pyrophosphatase MutT (NUDIX family)